MTRVVSSALADRLRWQDSSRLWRVYARGQDGLEITLLTCSGSEEMAHLVTNDPAVLELIGQRSSSQDDPACP
jgi:hypothetical protein